MTGKTAKTLRESCGKAQDSTKMTQKEWAKKLGQSEWTVKAWEQGKLKIQPHSENLMVLTAKGLIGETSVKEILSGAENEED